MKVLLTLALLLSAGVASAQNSDLGVLGGTAFTGDMGFGTQVNYAWQFWGRPASRLYVEAPIIIPVAQAANQINLYVTPGIRYQFSLTNRIALYAAAGAGAAIKANSPKTGVAYDLGIGLDLRLNRRWSLRGDARDLYQGPSSFVRFFKPQDYFENNKSVMVGIGLHF